MNILAVGAESKGCYALLKGQELFVSKEFGNLGDYSNLCLFEKSIKRDLKKFKPGIIACDMHPDYNSSLFAEDLPLKGARLIKIQHHHAHIAGCMQDNALKGRVIGIAFDGTGYGKDKNMWGGEFFISSFKDSKRKGHFKYLPMPGSDTAVKEPWRMGAVYLQDAFGDNFLNLNIPFVKNIKKEKWFILKRILSKGINSPLTSSAGRLFDAVAAIILGISNIRFEGEAAIKLERAAEKSESEDGVYKFNVVNNKGMYILDPKKMIKGIVKDIVKGVKNSIVAARFHNTPALMIANVCVKLRKRDKIDKVVLSGGVFQNKLLMEKTQAALKAQKFKVYSHQNFPTTDAGISAGQAVTACARS